LGGIFTQQTKNKYMMKYIPYTILSICFAVFVMGVYFVGNPSQARAERYDQQRIDDLRALHYGVQTHYQMQKKLPASLLDIDTDYGQMYGDPETGESYEYMVVSDNTYKICAIFSTSNMTEYREGHIREYQLSEKHEKGHHCFERQIPKDFLES